MVFRGEVFFLLAFILISMFFWIFGLFFSVYISLYRVISFYGLEIFGIWWSLNLLKLYTMRSERYIDSVDILATRDNVILVAESELFKI